MQFVGDLYQAFASSKILRDERCAPGAQGHRGVGAQGAGAQGPRGPGVQGPRGSGQGPKGPGAPGPLAQGSRGAGEGRGGRRKPKQVIGETLAAYEILGFCVQPI